MIGGYIDIFEAQTRISSLKDNRGGGNVVTTLLTYALSNKLIDEALAVRYSDNKPAEAIPFLAKTTDEIATCSGSKYTFVSYNGLTDRLGSRSAVVGLPCQIRQMNKRLLKIGLFCGLNLSYYGLRYILKKLKLKSDDIVCLDYRAPGRKGLFIKLKDGREEYFSSYWWLSFFFCYKKCLSCSDYTNHFADISVGDRRQDWSVVIVRTKEGNDLFNDAVNSGYITARRITLNDFLSKRMSPMIQKELRGGFINNRLIRLFRGKWVEYLPMSWLRQLGMYIAKRIR